MISKQGRFIFFHIPRTGGSSVQDCLWGVNPPGNPDFYGPYDWHAYGFKPHKQFDDPKKAFIGDIGDVTDHIGQEFYEWNINFLAKDSHPYLLNYGKEKFEEYFKFTFVRNPWDRFISLWVKFKEEEVLQMQFNSLFELHPNYDFKDPAELLKFLLLAHRKDLLLPRWFKPQYEYIHDKNLRILTNYVGQYEKFQFCFDFLCDRIDVPHKTLPWSTEEHRRHKKEEKHYTDYYDPVMISAVAEIYHDDIRTWGYEFGE